MTSWEDGVAEPDDYLLPAPWHLHCDGPPEKCVAFAARPLETLCRACREERLRRMSPNSVRSRLERLGKERLRLTKKSRRAFTRRPSLATQFLGGAPKNYATKLRGAEPTSTVPLNGVPSESRSVPLATTLPAAALSTRLTAVGQPEKTGGPSAGTGGAIVAVMTSCAENWPSAVVAVMVQV